MLFTFLHSLFSSPQPLTIHLLSLDPVSICGKDPSFNQSFICVRFLIRLYKWDHQSGEEPNMITYCVVCMVSRLWPSVTSDRNRLQRPLGHPSQACILCMSAGHPVGLYFNRVPQGLFSVQGMAPMNEDSNGQVRPKWP